MKRKWLLEGSSSGAVGLGYVLCREQRNFRRPMEFFRWFLSISPCMTPSKYRPWGFLGFKNIHRHVLQLQWLQTLGEFPQLGFHINIDSFFLSSFFLHKLDSKNIRCEQSVSLCTPPLQWMVCQQCFFPLTH